MPPEAGPSTPAAPASHTPIGVSLRNISLYLERAPLLARGDAAGKAPRQGLPILRGITGEVPAGSLFLIIGGSGSGKTSLLNALALRLGSVGYRLTGKLLRPSRAETRCESGAARAKGRKCGPQLREPRRLGPAAGCSSARAAPDLPV